MTMGRNVWVTVSPQVQEHGGMSHWPLQAIDGPPATFLPSVGDSIPEWRALAWAPEVPMRSP